MSERLPASLAYLLIYNPTLRPPLEVSKDDEDAEEEAHILFYTSRDRVASRDRMLRQVGLAKALVNFSEIFSGEPCDGVRSQGKRLVSVSPEPNFWMHACIEVARTPQSSKDKKKTGNNVNTSAKGSGYYYHDESINDTAIRSRLLIGYEDFKLLYDTYTSVLAEDGPQALQARLERFFTPWAWRWDIEEDIDLPMHLGIPLHPPTNSLTQLLKEFSDDLPQYSKPLLISPPYLIPFDDDERYYPQAFPRYLLSRVQRITKQLPPSRRTSTKNLKTLNGKNTTTPANATKTVAAGTVEFFTVVGDAMNPTKWTWPTFGLGKAGATGSSESRNEVQNGQATDPRNIPPEQDAAASDVHPEQVDGILEEPAETGGGPRQVAVDTIALEEAISTDQPPPIPEPLKTAAEEVPNVDFSVLTIYTSEPSNPLSTTRQRVFHLREHGLILALIMPAGQSIESVEQDLQPLAQKVPAFLHKVQEALSASTPLSKQDVSKDNKQVGLSKQLGEKPSYLITHDEHVVSSQGTISNPSSSYLFENKSLLNRGPQITEIFSRLTSPQNWLVTRRGLGSSNSGDNLSGELYMCLDRKDASLVDADNETEGAIRRWAAGES
ncbi:hypothetical protein M422DRAFT_63445 [Sphaerobolus stellatus SS14]|nr:hypothetical protein M422DRAFT_63445 [Sphaerobolus stellatus SS14]